jgi:tetraacyldisaccharide 4'-kinase
VTQKILNAWYKGAWWLSLLLPFASLYIWLRRVYLKSQPKARKNPLPLLVIGNSTIGGTGKTPLVVALTLALKDIELAIDIQNNPEPDLYIPEEDKDKENHIRSAV